MSGVTGIIIQDNKETASFFLYTAIARLQSGMQSVRSTLSFFSSLILFFLKSKIPFEAEVICLADGFETASIGFFFKLPQ